VTVYDAPTADAGPDKQILCGVGSVLIGGSPTASGGTSPYTYEWTPATGLDNAAIANPSASAAGNYTVTVIDSNGCTDSDDVTVTVTQCCCICGFVYRAGTMEPLAGWEVILEKNRQTLGLKSGATLRMPMVSTASANLGTANTG